MKQILHICTGGKREDVTDQVSCGFKYCPWCGKALIASTQKDEKDEYWYKVQVFASTQSYECIKYCLRSYLEIDPNGDDMRLYRIDKINNNNTQQALKVISYDVHILDTAIENNFEVR